MVGLIVKGDATAELQYVKPARIRRDCSDLRKVVDQITDTHPVSSFSSTSASLYNMNTGRATSDAARECLLSVPERGEQCHREFVETCKDDPKRFERRISKVKLVSFKDECVRNKRAVDKKITALKFTQDLMGRLTILASKRKLDLEHVFLYPLTSVTLSKKYPVENFGKQSP